MKFQEKLTVTLITTVALAISAVPALAQEPGGVFSGTLNGTPVTCQIWPMQSDFNKSGSTLTVSLMTSSCEGDDGQSQLALSFEQYGGTTNSAEIRVRGKGDSPDLYGDTDTGATLELQSATQNGDFLTLSGKVTAQVGPSDDYGRTIDLSAAQQLEVSFSGVIEVLGD